MNRIPWASLFATLVILAGPQAAFADEVTDWNQTMLRSALLGASSPTATARVAGMVHAAIFDAVNGVHPRYTPIYVEPAAPGGASARAAAVQAAYVILRTGTGQARSSRASWTIGVWRASWRSGRTKVLVRSIAASAGAKPSPTPSGPFGYSTLRWGRSQTGPSPGNGGAR